MNSDCYLDTDDAKNRVVVRVDLVLRVVTVIMIQFI